MERKREKGKREVERKKEFNRKKEKERKKEIERRDQPSLHNFRNFFNLFILQYIIKNILFLNCPEFFAFLH